MTQRDGGSGPCGPAGDHVSALVTRTDHPVGTATSCTQLARP
jgi:hypothetical protein